MGFTRELGMFNRRVRYALQDRYVLTRELGTWLTRGLDMFTKRGVFYKRVRYV